MSKHGGYTSVVEELSDSVCVDASAMSGYEDVESEVPSTSPCLSISNWYLSFYKIK